MDDNFSEPQVRGARPTRAVVTRQAEIRDWVQPSALPIPEPVDGYSFRWVRIGSLGNSDMQNFSTRRREGFEPVRAVDHPEFSYHEVEDGRFKGCVEVGGLLLCKVPTRIVQQRNNHYLGVTEAQSAAVDRRLENEHTDRRVKLTRNKHSEVRFGTGQ